MNVLIACEESQKVCKAFRAKGHNAYSCDIQECSGGHPEWHIQRDVLSILNGNCCAFTQDGGVMNINDKWDLIIAHPPCTDLAVSGAAWFEKKRTNGSQLESLLFFCKFFSADCERVAIENPVGIISGEYVKQWFPEIAQRYGLPKKCSQIIHPWQFGDNYEKTTCLWLKGLPMLIPETTKKPQMEYFEYIDRKKQKKRMPKWYSDAWHLPAAERARVRSETFPGIARAMAEQWSFLE